MVAEHAHPTQRLLGAPLHVADGDVLPLQQPRHHCGWKYRDAVVQIPAEFAFSRAIGMWRENFHVEHFMGNVPRREATFRIMRAALDFLLQATGEGQ